MSEKRFFNIATSRPDTNNPDKKYWSQHGILILTTTSQGEERIAIKLNSFPIGAEFDGWFSAFPKEETTRVLMPVSIQSDQTVIKVPT